MSKLGLLSGLGAGMSQVGQNMFEQAKHDRINEFRMQMQQGQQEFTANENAANRQQRADLQADQQRFTGEQARLQANNNLEVAKVRSKFDQAKEINGAWKESELADGSIVFTNVITGQQRFVSANPIVNVLNQGQLTLPGQQAQSAPVPGNVPVRNQIPVDQTEPRAQQPRNNPRANNSWYQNRN